MSRRFSSGVSLAMARRIRHARHSSAIRASIFMSASAALCVAEVADFGAGQPRLLRKLFQRAAARFAGLPHAVARFNRERPGEVLAIPTSIPERGHTSSDEVQDWR